MSGQGTKDVMYTHDFTRIQEGMDAYDRNGDKVGSIGKVYSMTGATTSTSTASPTSSAGSDGYLKVDTGLLGFGKDSYVPARAVASVADDRVILDVDKNTIDSFGWDEKPSFLRD
jgi:hypothetical protein